MVVNVSVFDGPQSPFYYFLSSLLQTSQNNLLQSPPLSLFISPSSSGNLYFFAINTSPDPPDASISFSLSVSHLISKGDSSNNQMQACFYKNNLN